jgi:hypothetical protein
MLGLPLSQLDFDRYKETLCGATPGDISLFGRVACPEMPHGYGYRNVPKRHTSYWRELSSYGRQIGRMTKRCFFRLLQEIVTPRELVISTPFDPSFVRQRLGASRDVDDVLVGASAAIRRRSDDHGKRIGSQLCSERHCYKLGGQAGPRSRAGKRIVT